MKLGLLQTDSGLASLVGMMSKEVLTKAVDQNLLKEDGNLKTFYKNDKSRFKYGAIKHSNDSNVWNHKVNIASLLDNHGHLGLYSLQEHSSGQTINDVSLNIFHSENWLGSSDSRATLNNNAKTIVQNMLLETIKKSSVGDQAKLDLHKIVQTYFDSMDKSMVTVGEAITIAYVVDSIVNGLNSDDARMQGIASQNLQELAELASLRNTEINDQHGSRVRDKINHLYDQLGQIRFTGLNSGVNEVIVPFVEIGERVAKGCSINDLHLTTNPNTLCGEERTAPTAFDLSFVKECRGKRIYENPRFKEKVASAVNSYVDGIENRYGIFDENKKNAIIENLKDHLLACTLDDANHKEYHIGNDNNATTLSVHRNALLLEILHELRSEGFRGRNVCDKTHNTFVGVLPQDNGHVRLYKLGQACPYPA